MVEPPAGKFSSDAIAVVVSLDTWLETSRSQQHEVIRRAIEMSTAKDPEIEAVDQVPVAFCNIDDLEFVLQRCSCQFS